MSAPGHSGRQHTLQDHGDMADSDIDPLFRSLASAEDPGNLQTSYLPAQLAGDTSASNLDYSHLQYATESSKRQAADLLGGDAKRQVMDSTLYPAGPSGQDDSGGTRRATQACLRCRRQKLKCVGGNPCERCVKSKNICDFGTPGSSRGQHAEEKRKRKERESAVQVNSDNANARLAQLESSVANLLAGLAQSAGSLKAGDNQLIQQLREDIDDGKYSAEGSAWQDQSSKQLKEEEVYSRHTGPELDFGGAETDYANGRHEETLAAVARAMEERAMPWEAAAETLGQGLGIDQQLGDVNRLPAGSSSERRMYSEDDDPVSLEWIPSSWAGSLVYFFFEHCHRFLPILDADARDRTSVITKSTFLFSTVVAIAARYYDRETERQKIDGYRPLEKGMSEKCGELAMTHLRRVMLGSRFAVADIQAILLLASWRVGIHEHEVNEHLLVRCAGTILEQMGLGSILNQGIRSPKDISDESMKPLAPALRAWFAIYGLDSGFALLNHSSGLRIAESEVDETKLLKYRTKSPPPSNPSYATGVNGDVYLCSQVALGRIAAGFTSSARSTVDELSAALESTNQQLDAWIEEWTEDGSAKRLGLGSSTWLAMINANYIRLRLNAAAFGALRSNYTLAKKDSWAINALQRALEAAKEVIKVQLLKFTPDRMALAVVQAATMLVRATQLSQEIQKVAEKDLASVGSDVQTVLDALEKSDLSEPKAYDTLARALREIAFKARVEGVAPSATMSQGTSREIPLKLLDLTMQAHGVEDEAKRIISAGEYEVIDI